MPLPKLTCSHDDCSRVAGHCFSCLFKYLLAQAQPVQISGPAKRADDIPCNHTGASCVCRTLMQIGDRD